jgi:isopentenyl diphosphate isomerase/L-lactate dehydrogenase-like FMN-dependent dehydrogenase
MATANDSSLETSFLTTTEIVDEARKRLSDTAWDFICGGAETETTLLRNRHALDAISFRPRVLRNIESADPSRIAFGAKRRLPVLLAPLGGMTEFHDGGALPSAEAAHELGCLMMLSSVTEPGLETIAQVAREQLIYQLYVHGDERWVAENVKRAVDAGVRALCITVDVAHYGRRERSLLRRHSVAGRALASSRLGEEHSMRVDWDFIARLKQGLEIPLILKGIATAEDAALALEQGVDVVYVSNHGGRQLDHGRGAMDLLAEVQSTVRGKAQVIVDGGFMRGTDVLKALAMGASLVGVGRLQALALAAGGREGVVRMLELLEAELVVAMKLIGITSLDELDGSCLHPTLPVARPEPLGAFPLRGGTPQPR